MKYNLKTPCAHCPFRSDIRPFIRPERVEEIAYGNAEFPCHKTLNYHTEDADGEGVTTEDTQHCAGLLILLEREEQPHQMMRICERLNLYDRTKLDMNAPVYDDIESAIEAHEDQS